MKKVFSIFMLISFLWAAGDFTLLPRQTEYTKPFFEKYPDYNGKGITIFIMDTGIEIDLAGLRKNPDGSPKVVDVFDASRSGNVAVEKAVIQEIDSIKYLTDGKDYYLRDFDDYDFPEDKVYIAAFEESQFKNRDIKDINGNGTTDDAWMFITYPQADENWVVVMDLDRDGSLTKEKILHNYHVNHEYVRLPRKNPFFNHQWLSLAINVYPHRKVVNFHFDDGAHGTHVAGIAAGYQLHDDPEINGLAPGAKLVSIKIGNGACPGNATVTGSKKRGLEFIDQYMREHPGYGIINMSYGIASSNEGFSMVDDLFNQFAINHPNVMVCTSAGNEGPGISTIGTPAAGQFLISSGAIMWPTTARDKYGWKLQSPKILQFSSRGGEAAKPDLISPGAMISTVPQWSGGDFFWGTSMASPYTAGALATVLSGLKQLFPKRLAASALVQHGIRMTSQPLDEYTLLDQGGGVVQLLPLFDWLKNEIIKQEPLHHQLATKAFVPTLPLKKAPSSYWRVYDIAALPEELEVNVRAVFNENVIQSAIDGFFMKYALKSDVRWVKPAERRISILRDNQETIRLDLDVDNMPSNSVQTGRIQLIPQGDFQNITQEFWVTIVNPLHFNRQNNFTYQIKDQQVELGLTDRYFLAVPNGATSMFLKLSTDEKEYANIRPYLFDEHGLEVTRIPHLLSEYDVFEVNENIDTKLHGGIWELDLYGNLSSKQISEYDLEISFCGIQFDRDARKVLRFSDGSQPSFSGKLSTTLDSYRFVNLMGSVTGYAQQHTLSFGDQDTLNIPFHKNETDGALQFRLTMPLKYHSNFTDLVILVENNAGEFVTSGGIAAGRNTFNIPASLSTGTYTLKIMVAYADYVNKEKFDLSLEEVHFFKKPYMGADHFENNTIYQGLAYDYHITLADTPPMVPDGFYYFGEISVIQRNRILGKQLLRLER